MHELTINFLTNHIYSLNGFKYLKIHQSSKINDDIFVCVNKKEIFDEQEYFVYQNDTVISTLAFKIGLYISLEIGTQIKQENFTISEAFNLQPEICLLKFFLDEYTEEELSNEISKIIPLFKKGLKENMVYKNKKVLDWNIIREYNHGDGFTFFYDAIMRMFLENDRRARRVKAKNNEKNNIWNEV